MKPKAKNPEAVSLGARGGHARARKMTAAERSASARKAVAARWARRKLSTTPARGTMTARPN